ncbi:MAG: NUDIX hydrolase [Bacilli bacterium]|jgi:8-oxo-dGTP diphosphatase
MIFKYTLVFIKCEDEILLINREKPSWMGRWNGIGGRIEDGETPDECAKRELFEETGMVVDDLQCLAKVGWIISDDYETLGGMYCYLGEIDHSKKIHTPVKTDEGIIDWKKISWIMDEENTGIPDNIPTFLPGMLVGDYKTYLCKYLHKFDLLGETIEHSLEFPDIKIK